LAIFFIIENTKTHRNRKVFHGITWCMDLNGWLRNGDLKSCTGGQFLINRIVDH
jgi:hypothetical protein